MYVVYSSITCQYKDIPVWSVTAGRPEDRMIKDRVERGVPRQHMPAYYLDLLEHRDISNSIATRVNVQHESPQLLILRNGVCTSHASHNAIQPEMLGI